MPRTVRYLTHPQVRIEPEKTVPNWSLNEIGAGRVVALASRPGLLALTRRVVCSNETKAIETAQPIANALGVDLEMRPRMHENDRSATGFLPPEEFENTADAFFANPSQSVRGWETAQDAQRRIVEEVETCLSSPGVGDVPFVGHGGIGTLLFCALSGFAIDRRFDQGPGGGGCWFEFEIEKRKPLGGWQPMEVLSRIPSP